MFLFVCYLLLITSGQAQLKKVDLVATGLTCSMCSNAIYKQLESIDGVDKIEIDLNKNLFTIILKPNHKLTPKDFKEKVEKAGFFIGSMVLYISYSNLTLEDGKQEGEFIFIEVESQIITGENKFKVVDKGYVTVKEFKKYSKTYTKYPSLVKNSEDDFHLKLVQ